MDTVRHLNMIAEAAFDNRAGATKNVSSLPYELVYEGDEDKFGCLDLGISSLWKKKDFVSYIEKWDWVDEYEPDESCDVIRELSIPVR